MKKFLLLMAGISVCLCADAITLTFWMGNKQITPDETVKFTDIQITEYEEDEYKEVKMDPNLYISSNIFSSDVKITATCTSGQSIQMCAGGTCRGGEKVVKEGVTVRPNQKLELGFDYSDEFDLDEKIPTVTTLIEAEDVTESGSKVQFVIVMGEKDASISTVEVADDFKAVEGGIAYKTDEPCSVKIATVSGISVYSGTVSGNGTINLPGGLYVYTFGNRSGKIYIR